MTLSPSFDVRRRLSLLLLVVVSGLAVLQVWPVQLPSNDPKARPALPQRETGHPVLLLIDPSLLAARGSPADLQWVDLLGRLFGGCDVRPLQDLDANEARLLRGRRLAVIPRGTLAPQSSQLVPRLRPFVEAGLVVLLEAPPHTIAQTLGIEVTGVESRPRLPWPQRPHVTSLGEDFRLPPPYALDLRYPVASARPAPIRGPRPRPTLSPAGRPLVWTLPEGSGGWVLHMLDLGALTRALHQGAPGSEAGPTADRVVTERLRTTDYAWSDAWVQAVLDPDGSPAPWPQLWPAPAALDGWLLVTQDLPSGGEGDPALTRFAQAGAAEGLLGVWPDAPGPGSRPPGQRLGLGPLQLAWRPAGLATQARSLQPSPRLHRNRAWSWPADADEAWASLVGAGFRADSSFGPPVGKGGWTAGTSLPFRPLSAGGLPHAIWELPVHWRGPAAALDPDRLARWLRENGRGSHGAVHVAIEGSLPPGLLASLSDLARRHRHAVVSARDLLDTWERRASLEWRWEFSGRTLRVEIGPSSAADPPLATVVPLAWNGQRLLAWDASWAQARGRRARSFGRAVLVVEHPPGGGALTFTYGRG